jgi:tyrosyl-tRNA synthetase
MMSLIEELQWRGLLHDCTPGLDEALSKGKLKGYVGYDPTAPSLTIGNYVTIMLLIHLQRYGHYPIVLMGGATGRIGDPSGKDKERQLKSFEELDNNLHHQITLFKKFLDFEGENKAEIVNNLDIYKNMDVISFLRDIGKNLTVNYMLAKDSVKNRLETGISFTEFSYQLLQGYDFQWLYENKGCTLQLGGSDQWGNITSGTHMISKNIPDAKAFALTCPLLTKSDGKKFGKSEEGNIWLDASMTSPYKFYQFWLNAADDDIVKFNRVFSLKTVDELKALETAHLQDPHLRILQKSLAEELTIRIHSQEAFDAALSVSELIFNKKLSREALFELSIVSLEAVKEEIPSSSISKNDLKEGINVLDLLSEKASIVSSKGDARRAIQGNAITINKLKINSHEHVLTIEELIHDRFLMVENGKKNQYLIEVV